MTIGFLIKFDSRWHTRNPNAGEATTFLCLFGTEETRIRFRIETVADQAQPLVLLTGVLEPGNRRAAVIYNKSTGGGAGLFL